MKALFILLTICIASIQISAAQLSLAPEIDRQTLDAIWDSLDNNQVIKLYGKDKYVSYYWAHEIENRFDITAGKIVIHYTNKFLHHFRYGSYFATALVVRVGQTFTVLDKTRFDTPVTITQWRTRVLTEAATKLEEIRKNLVKDLKKTQTELNSINRYGGWAWNSTPQTLQEKIDLIYNQMDELGVNEYGTAALQCGRANSEAEFRTNPNNSWCFEHIIRPIHFTLLDHLKTTTPQESSSQSWNEWRLRQSREQGFIY